MTDSIDDIVDERIQKLYDEFGVILIDLSKAIIEQQSQGEISPQTMRRIKAIGDIAKAFDTKPWHIK